MSTKDKKTKTRKVADIRSNKEGMEEEKLSTAQFLLNPHATSALIISRTFDTGSESPVAYIAKELINKSDAIISGDMKAVEQLLIAQAFALNNIFADSLRKAMGSTPQFVPHIRSVNEVYAKIGLKAQAQCRATLETLANIKNPPQLAFVRQQNIAYQQQVNNKEASPPQPESKVEATPVNDEPRARGNNKIFTNELLETSNNVTRLELGTKKKAGGTNKELVPVE